MKYIIIISDILIFLATFIYSDSFLSSGMGDIDNSNQKKLEKKYKDILSYKDLIKTVNDFDERLKKIRENTDSFEKELKPLKAKEQKQVREF